MTSVQQLVRSLVPASGTVMTMYLHLALPQMPIADSMALCGRPHVAHNELVQAALVDPSVLCSPVTQMMLCIYQLLHDLFRGLKDVC